MIKNTNLQNAKSVKNDEFYTKFTDIEKEIEHYKTHLKNKIVYCNCDDPTYSAFWKYFHLNFATLGLKKLISTHYDKDNPTYKMEYVGGYDTNIQYGTKTPLQGNGDFRSQECIKILKETDIVVTNPPFSLFSEFVVQLMEYGKLFLILGNQNAITYKEIFPLFKDNKIWWGVSDCVHWFIVPDDIEINSKINSQGERIAEGARSRWWTNLDHKKRYKDLILSKKYSLMKYPQYDNYNAINVDKTSNIPYDYDGVMGVPITFLDKYSPEQFEIIGTDEAEGKGFSNGLFIDGSKYKQCYVSGNRVYKRIFIRKK